MARASKESSKRKSRTNSNAAKARDMYIAFDFSQIVELLPRTKMAHIYGTHIRRKQVGTLLTRALCFMVDDMIDYDDYYQPAVPHYKAVIRVEEYDIVSPDRFFNDKETKLDRLTDTFYLAVTSNITGKTGKNVRTKVTLNKADRFRLEDRLHEKPRLQGQRIVLDAYTERLYEEFPGFTIDDIRYIVRFGINRLVTALVERVPVCIKADYFTFRTFPQDYRKPKFNGYYDSQARKDIWLHKQLANSTIDDAELREMKETNDVAYVYFTRDRYEDEIEGQIGNEFVIIQDVKAYRYPEGIVNRYKYAKGVIMKIHGFHFDISQAVARVPYFEAYDNDIEIIDNNNI